MGHGCLIPEQNQGSVSRVSAGRGAGWARSFLSFYFCRHLLLSISYLPGPGLSVYLHRGPEVPSEGMISPIMCVRKPSSRQVRGQVRCCPPRSGCIQTGVTAQPRSDALLHCWSSPQRPRPRRSANSGLGLPVLVTLTSQELGPVGLLPPSTTGPGP